MEALTPRATCQRVGCEKPGVWTPIFVVHTIYGPKEAGATLSFCEDCRAYALEKILPEVARDEAEYPFRVAGLLGDKPTTFELVRVKPKE